MRASVSGFDVKAHLGMSPIAWWNDDLQSLSEDISLSAALAQIFETGYSGVEMGRRFPSRADELGDVLRAHGLHLCGGWYSGTMLEGDLPREKDRIAPMIELFKALDAPCIVYGETADTVQGDQGRPLGSRRTIDDRDMPRYGAHMTQLAQWCAEQNMPLSFHHHMGTAIESEGDVDRLMATSGEALGLLLDTGHLCMAGGDIAALIDRHGSRISHVHVKDVRRSVLRGMDLRATSFLDAVVRGAFTVPGDGDIDFADCARRLADSGYEGWFVVEAEQDPKRFPPKTMARIASAHMVPCLTDAGYTVSARAESMPKRSAPFHPNPAET